MKLHTHKLTFIAVGRFTISLESESFPTFILLSTNPVKTRSLSNATCLLAARSDVVNDCFTFQQQNNAPIHRAGDMVALQSAETPDFIGLAPSPLDNPDLNSVD